ncbi:MAG: VOC family protein [Pseudomonadota bacterium]
MPNPLVHFAIEADDVERARRFYETVFDWQFAAWGPPGFYRISGCGIHGALQQRNGSATPGAKGFECTVAVDDIQSASDAIERAGGTLLSEPFTIPNVGTLRKFRDTEQNEVIVMEYTETAANEMGIG